MSTTPPSSSDDSPTTSGGDNPFPHEDTDMLDYDEYSHALGNDSSPPPLFFGDRLGIPQNTPRFTISQVSHEGLSPFSTPFTGLNPTRSSPEFEPDGDSPELGSDMRGLRLNSRFASPVQGTVRMEDVMLPTDNLMANTLPQSGTMFENKVEIQRVGTGSSHPYIPREAFSYLFSNFPYSLVIVGIPPSGAKSRVETQIKLDLQLFHHRTQELVKDEFNFLKLPSYGVSKEKFRLANLKGFFPYQDSKG